MRIFLFTSIVLVGCDGATPENTDPATVADTNTDTATDLPGCGDAPPSITSFSVANGSEAPGATVLLELAIQHPDGDLVPTIEAAVFWDATIDNATDANSNVFVLQLGAPPDAVACETTAVTASVPVTMASITPVIPFNTMVEFQIGITDASGVADGEPEGNFGVSAVFVFCTPNADGTDGTCI